MMNESELTLLFRRIEAGDRAATEELLPLVYQELRRLAARHLTHERDARTLQATALVHEAWLRLGGDEQPDWKGRGHFFSAAGEAMRRILVDRARRKQAARRGARAVHVSWEKTGFEMGAEETPDEELLQLNEALEALAEADPRRADLVKQRFFVGLTVEQTAEVMGVSVRTVKRDWAYARAWLMEKIREMREAGD
ncbi:ECF-type sigma factor [Actomonas aquatica]|uniref:ECF-type sigma factor n=1 Tax=Actomonas aquatica TaxID=2866162 RepID=A0ABZ1C444_9BACT|nr:ECF-type sigma factor [Opitutus sp. WL0086]WRQ86459.1 ECF-type sigma factor [Opitutus sp. WL0086]